MTKPLTFMNNSLLKSISGFKTLAKTIQVTTTHQNCNLEYRCWTICLCVISSYSNL